MNDELSRNARTLLDAARHQGGPTTAQKAKLTVAVMTATAGTAAAMTTGAAATGTSVAKLVGAGLIATLVGVSGTVLVKTVRAPARAHPPAVVMQRSASPVVAPPPVVAELPSPVAPPIVDEATPPSPVAPTTVDEATPPSPVAPPTVVEATQPLPEPAPTVRAAPIAAPPPPRIEPTAVEPMTPAASAPNPVRHAALPDTTAAEVTALGAALEGIEEGRPLEALEAARSARRAAPNGALRPELTVVEIEALCALHREAEAAELAASMPERDRTPLVVQRLRRTCTAR
jgi:hypothetical protein